MIRIIGHYPFELFQNGRVSVYNRECSDEIKVSIGYYYDAFDEFKRTLSEKSGLTFETKRLLIRDCIYKSCNVVWRSVWKTRLNLLIKYTWGKKRKVGKIAGVFFAIVLIVFFYCRRSRWHISIHFRLSGIQFDNTGGKKTSTYILTVAFFEVDSENSFDKFMTIQWGNKRNFL